MEWIQKQIVATIEVIPQEQIEEQIGDIPVPQEQLIAEVTTLNTSSTPTSSDRRLDEFANMLDSCIELLTPVTAQIDSIEKETERAAMLTKRMMETPLPDLHWWSLIGPLRNAVDEHAHCLGSWKLQCTWLQARGRLRGAPDCMDGVRDGNMDTFYNELKVAPEEHPVLPTDSMSYRERMTQTRFETFNVPAMYLAAQTVPFASGHTTDIVMDSGDSVPIYESDTLRHDILCLAGRDSSEYLMTNFTEQGYALTATAERRMIQDLIENFCYIVVDDATELKSTADFDNEKTRELTDRDIISVGAERFHCVDMLLQPNSIDKEACGTHNTSLQNNMNCDVCIRKELCAMSCCHLSRPCSIVTTMTTHHWL